MNNPPPFRATDLELLAEVDEQDVVIGSRIRKEIHELGLRHRAVHILVFNTDGCLLLQKRSMNKDVNPGAWDTSAAGHVDFGESYEAAAIRELHEELGIICAQPLKSVGRIMASAETGWEFVEVFAASHEGDVKPNPEEIADHAWFQPKEVDAFIQQNPSTITRSFQRVWTFYLSSKDGSWLNARLSSSL